MSMVGYCIGLGDRHLENIMLNTKTGEILHVDFNSLFFHGSLLPIAEVVPFRLTQNIEHGLGLLKTHGHYRNQAIKTQTWVRENAPVIFSVLNCLFYDPIAEFNLKEGSKNSNKAKKIDRKGQHLTKGQEEIFMSIRRKINGNVGKYGEPSLTKLSVESQVDMLIAEAKNPANLSRMFSGWAPWL